MSKCNLISFENQVIFIGIDVHKNNWNVNMRHCGRELSKFNMNPSPELLAEHLKTNYPGAEFRSVYEAGFCGFWIHRRLCDLGIKNIVINPADVPTSGKEKLYKNDQIDSKKLSRELENESLVGIYIPSEENLRLRSLVRRETQIVKNIIRTKNRIKSHFNFHGRKFYSWAARNIRIMEK